MPPTSFDAFEPPGVRASISRTRRALFALMTSPALERLVCAAPGAERRAYAARRYVAGVTPQDMRETVRRLHDQGMAASSMQPPGTRLHSTGDTPPPVSRVLATVDAVPARVTPGLRLVAIDGPGASGKSTLASALAEARASTVVHGDDFYTGLRRTDRPWATSYGLDRLREEVLEPAAAGERVLTYRRYDWAEQAPQT